MVGKNIMTPIKSLLRKVALVLLDPYIVAAEVRKEKPKLADQLKDYRTWYSSFMTGVYNSAISMSFIATASLLAQNASNIEKGVSNVSGEVGCAMALSGIGPIYHHNGFALSTQEMTNGTCGNTLVGRAGKRILTARGGPV